MKKFLLVLISVIVVAIIGFFVYVNVALPNVSEPENISVNKSQANVEHGKYLAEHVAVCMDCHSKRDWSLYAAPVKDGTWGEGGEAFTEAMGLPGNIYSKNLTPVGLSDWTDGEIFRAITCGVSKDGTPLFPLMPYPNYSQMDPSDVKDIIAYLRTLPSKESDAPERELNFPMNMIVNFIPKDAEMSSKPAKSDKVAYGKYVATMASCGDCHTPFQEGEYDMSKRYAGGREFQFPDGKVLTTPNITFHESGLKGWTEQQFITKFKSYADTNFVPHKVEKDEFNTIMPWIYYSGMKEEDLAAIYAYLKSLKPIENKVEKYKTVASSK